MKRTFLTLLSLAALALSACDESSDQLTNGGAGGSRTPAGPGDTAGDENGTYNHNNDPGAPADGEGDYRDLPQIKVIGSPEVTSRLHACGKLTINSLGDLLTSRGLTGTGGGRPNGAQSGQQIFNANATKAALGDANYGGRVPESSFASTSAMSKMFDIFTMASYDAVAANFNAPACPGVKVLDAGKFTKDGLSCLMGKPATDEHVAIANDVIAKNPTDGAKIAIAALLSAAHTCQ